MDKLIGLGNVVARLASHDILQSVDKDAILLEFYSSWKDVVSVKGINNIIKLQGFLNECLDEIETIELEEDFKAISNNKKMEILNEQSGTQEDS